MEAKTKVKIRNGAQYDHLFPKARAIDKTVKKGATVADTVHFIPMVVRNTVWQARRYVEEELKGLATYEACRKLWHFLKYHVEYEPDERGHEQVRTVRRVWHDKKADCDCLTTFVDTVLYALRPKDVKYIMNRITEYDHKGRFQHIYPIICLTNGKSIVMDVVAEEFDYEVPFTKKEDYKMDLQILDGIDEKELSMLGIDAQDLLGYENDLAELGKLFKKGGGGAAKPKPKIFQKVAQKVQTTKNKVGQKVQAAAKKTGAVAKKALHAVNKINPATALLRAGVLASMKLNVLNVGGQLKYAYMTDEQARAQGADMARLAKLRNVLKKTEDIFTAAGGEPKNLKNAILTGKGNANKEVLAGYDSYEPYVGSLNGYTPLQDLLGTAVYTSEFVEGVEGLSGEGLGEPATATALAAASTAIAAIAGLLKSIGTIFPKKQAAPAANPDAAEQSANDPSGSNAGESSTSLPDVQNSPSTDSASEAPAPEERNISTNENSSTDSGDGVTETNNSSSAANKSISTSTPVKTNPTSGASKSGFMKFYEENKKWIKPAGIGLGVVAALAIGYKMMKGGNGKTSNAVLQGVPKTKKANNKKAPAKKKGKVSVIKLM